MKTCPTCGHQSGRSEMKCPVCGNYYSKILELIDEEEEKELKNSFRGRCRRIIASENIRQALTDELNSIKAGMTGKARFTLFVIFAFIFALILSVL
ncbi:MAG: hypothetical protein ACU841_10000 [Gammaproteobacteria bacterium]